MSQSRSKTEKWGCTFEVTPGAKSPDPGRGQVSSLHGSRYLHAAEVHGSY